MRWSWRIPTKSHGSLVRAVVTRLGLSLTWRRHLERHLRRENPDRGGLLGWLCTLRLKTLLVDAQSPSAPEVSIRADPQGHRDRFLAAGGYSESDWDDVGVASRLDLTLALSTAPFVRGPKPKVFLNRAAMDYEGEQSAILTAQTLQDSVEKAWAALAVDAEHISTKLTFSGPHRLFMVRLSNKRANGRELADRRPAAAAK